MKKISAKGIAILRDLAILSGGHKLNDQNEENPRQDSEMNLETSTWAKIMDFFRRTFS